MARSRNIKPGFFSNDQLAEINPLGRLLFIGLWTIADRKGRLEDRPKKIKVDVLPYDSCNVDKLLDELQARKFIVRYEVGGARYIQVLNFTKHQNPHTKEAESIIPEPCQSPTEPQAGPVLAPTQDVASPADSLLLIPDSLQSDSGFLIPDSSIPPRSGEPDSAPAKRNGSAKKIEVTVLTAATWTAYAFAYRARYGTDPVRNKKVNGQLKNLVERIGESEAPAVAAHYVRSNRGLYVSAKHCVDLLLRDCEGLRTEWATGRTVTDTEARNIDRKQNNLGVAERLIAENEERRAHGK